MSKLDINDIKHSTVPQSVVKERQSYKKMMKDLGLAPLGYDGPLGLQIIIK